MMNETNNATYRLVVTEWDGEDDCFEGGAPVTRDRYFGTLDEVVSRLCYPWLSGFNHAIYQRQTDGSWLLYYHSIWPRTRRRLR